MSKEWPQRGGAGSGGGSGFPGRRREGQSPPLSRPPPRRECLRSRAPLTRPQTPWHTVGEGILALGWRGLGAAQREAAGARRGDAGAGRGESALHLGGRRLQADPELRSRGALRPVPRSQPGRGTGRGATGAGGGLDVRRCGSLGLPMLTEPENNVTSRPTPAAGGERRREPLPGVAGGVVGAWWGVTGAEPIAGVWSPLRLIPRLPNWLSRSILGFQGHCRLIFRAAPWPGDRRQSRDSGHRHARGAWSEAKLTQASASSLGNGFSNRVSRGSGENLWRKG